MRALFTIVWLLVIFASILRALRKPAGGGPTVVVEPEPEPEPERAWAPPATPPPGPAAGKPALGARPVTVEPASRLLAAAEPAPAPAPPPPRPRPVAKPRPAPSEPEVPAPPREPARVEEAQPGRWFLDLEEAQRGIILAEILGPPIALREASWPEWRNW